MDFRFNSPGIGAMITFHNQKGRYHMEYSLDDVEARILGVLIEKQMATPDYYPLTMNALINACNQKSNRNPVMSLDESRVSQAIDSLKKSGLVWQVKTHGSRSDKFEHNMKDVGVFSQAEKGILCVLLLRGPQTPGELKSRTSRLCKFHGTAAVEHTLQKLMEHEDGCFVKKLPVQPGLKECRYTQLFHEVSLEELFQVPAAKSSAMDDTRISELEKRIEVLETELSEMRDIFNEFKKQFE